MNPANATTARFIKLGASGEWEAECIRAPGTIRLGFNNPLHQSCLDGDWDALTAFMRENRGKTKGKATEITNQVRDFYSLDESVLWITFYRRQLFWCFAASEITQLEDGTRIRKALNGWSNRSIGGSDLFIESLSGSLTKTQGFRGTICSVEAFEYLKRRLCDEVLPEVDAARECLSNLHVSLVPLIRSLNWKDFELLCDLIFSNAGWQRIATLGGTEKSIDLDMVSPVTQRRLFVQVKSHAAQDTFRRYLDEFEGHDQYDEMYFIVHSSKGDALTWSNGCDGKIKVLVADDVARLTVSAGLIDWLIRKSS